MLVEGGQPEANLRRAGQTIRSAASKGADLVLLPEALDCGWCDRSALRLAEPLESGSSLTQLCQHALAAGVSVCAGLTERDSGRIYNSAVLIDSEGNLLLSHRKVNELAIGRKIYSSGKAVNGICETRLGTLGIMICADAFFPEEALTRSLAEKGAQLIVSPCAWAVPPDHDQEREPYGGLWRDVYGRVAREHGIWIAGASNVGEIRHGDWGGHPCVGCSLVVGPDGEVRAEGPYREEEIVYASISLPK